jgi:vacuolar-type H+-ATPase subunit I/STV1
VAKRDLQRLRETTPTENSLIEGFRWQPHHQARVLWANNLHTLNQAIKEMPTERNQTDSRSTTFGMKRTTKIWIWNVRTLKESGRLQTWRRSVHKEAIEEGMSWCEVKRMARNRIRWRRLVDALCP